MVNLLVEKNPSVNRAKQRTAFPPNFIHSVDSAHMMFTALACHKAGLCFAGVHDSFWSHARDMTLCNTLLRREFVRMHQEPILQNLKDELTLKLHLQPTPADPLSTPHLGAARGCESSAQVGGGGKVWVATGSDGGDLPMDASGQKGAAGPRKGAAGPQYAKLPDVPPPGKLDLNMVLTSTYFFS